MPDDDVKGKVVRLLGAAKPVRRRARPAGVVQSAIGEGNIQAGRDVHIKTERLVTRPRVTVVPGYGVVSEPQKARLLELCDRWVVTNDAVRRTKLSYEAARGALKRKARVTSYHLIPADQFAMLERWLLTQIARVNAMPSAAARSPSWRNDRIKAIQARCNERGFQERRRTYMLERFGVSSMTGLTDGDLGRLYSAVMGW